MRKFLTLFVALIIATVLWAEKFQYGDLYYNITSSSEPYTVEVTYKDDRFGYNYPGLTTATIPRTVTYYGTTYSVTSIGADAFYSCYYLDSINIPNSVTSIGYRAFQDCHSLTSIIIPNSVTRIRRQAFDETGIYRNKTNWENGVLYISHWLIEANISISGSYSIKDNTRLIGDFAFQNCSSITSIIIPNGVTSIGYRAFQDCHSLTSITCEAETPPTAGRSAFSGINTEIPVYVPCGCVVAYKVANEWKSFTNIQVSSLDCEEDDIITCDEAVMLCEATGTTITTEQYTIRGYVTEIKTAYSEQYNNITFWMADTPHGGKVLQAYRVIPVEANDIDVKVGDYVEVIGSLVNYYGTTPEVYTGGIYTILPKQEENGSTTEEEYITACDSYEWHGETYTESGDYTYTTTTENGCEHVEILHLTIYKSEYVEFTETACDSYVWNGVTYTESGDYTYNTTTAAGCERVEVLHLTINKSEHVEFTETACDSYEWNGVTYTESGDYTYNTTTAAGCERIEVLHLTINNSEYVEESITACDSYEWHGIVYTESGDYTYTTTTEQGCERVEVLHLTILPDATTESEELALCPSELPYEWYGQMLTEAGSYTATEQYAGMECDSVIHELTLNVYVQTLPASVTLPIIREGEAIDVAIPTAEIQAHIAAETWYAPNAEVAWYIMDNSDWAALTAEPVKAGMLQVTLKYAVATDCGNVESDDMVIDVIPTSVDNTNSQSPISNYQKILYEDHIYILRDGKIYSIMGYEM